MEELHLHDRQHVWLRSAVHGTYLHADEDGHGVSLSRRRASMKSAWVVHRYYGDHLHVLFHSAAYGRYLSATEASAPRGCRGFRVEQRNYGELDDVAIRWQPLRARTRDEILLRHVVAADGDNYGHLRANGRDRPSKKHVVSVDRSSNVSTMMGWMVEPIPSRERIPRLPRPTWLHLHLPALLPSRVVMFTGNGEGWYGNDVSFTFKGRSAYRLRNELARRLGIPMNASNNIVMYVRAGTFGRFTPLVVDDLPRSRQTLVITADTPANGGPRYPDFDAE